MKTLRRRYHNSYMAGRIDMRNDIMRKLAKYNEDTSVQIVSLIPIKKEST